MKLGSNTVQFSWEGISMLGNLRTGAVMGLTQEGSRLCAELARHDVAPQEIPPSCGELVEHLERGGYLDGAPAPRQPISSAYLHVTQRCNLSCAFCYSKDGGRNSTPDPTLDELSRAISLLSSLGCRRLVISGGEPFLRSDLGDIAQLARSAGMSEVVVLTNGLLVSEEALRKVREHVGCVAVAFDGTSASAVAHLRGEQLFDQLVAAVKAITEAGIEARVLPTLHAKNFDELPRYQALAKGLGATLSYSLLTAPACDLGEFVLSKEALHDLGVAAAAGGTELSPSHDALPNVAARVSCGAGVRTLSIDADGTVYPCHMFRRPELAMGNAFVDSADAIMSSEVARAMRALDVRDFEDCRDCASRFLCGGGCRARSLLDRQDILGRDPYCKLYRSYYKNVGERLSVHYGRR